MKKGKKQEFLDKEPYKSYLDKMKDQGTKEGKMALFLLQPSEDIEFRVITSIQLGCLRGILNF